MKNLANFETEVAFFLYQSDYFLQVAIAHLLDNVDTVVNLEPLVHSDDMLDLFIGYSLSILLNLSTDLLNELLDLLRVLLSLFLTIFFEIGGLKQLDNDVGARRNLHRVVGGVKHIEHMTKILSAINLILYCFIRIMQNLNWKCFKVRRKNKKRERDIFFW